MADVTEPAPNAPIPPSSSSSLTTTSTFDDALQQFYVALEETRLASLRLDENGGESSSPSWLCGVMPGLDSVAAAIDALVSHLADAGLVVVAVNREDMSEVGSVVPVPEELRSHAHEEEDVRLLTARHCSERGCDLALSILDKACSGSGSGGGAGGGGEGEVDDVQPTVARIAELTVRLSAVSSDVLSSSKGATTNGLQGGSAARNYGDNSNNDDVAFAAIKKYASYQRKVLRTRSKPSIARIAELRKASADRSCTFVELLLHHAAVAAASHHDEDENGGASNVAEETMRWRNQPHGHAVTTILGEASTLVHPLAAWRDSILLASSPSPGNGAPLGMDPVGRRLVELCNGAISTLDVEARTLATTVGEWFLEDREVSKWAGGGDDEQQPDLSVLDATLDEMSFLCQVIARYCSFAASAATTTTASSAEEHPETTNNDKLRDHLQEQSLLYSTLETRLLSLNFDRALAYAAPQEAVLGDPSLLVPSVVEDAFYVCRKAVERASGTRSDKAVWSVGHWVCELWRAGPGGGVHDALVEGRGCHRSEEDRPTAEVAGGGSKGKAGGSGSNTFASAFLDALDDDIGGGSAAAPPSSPSSSKSRPLPSKTMGGGRNSAPSSGSLLLPLGIGSSSSREAAAAAERKVRLSAALCALNGVNAAGSACAALSELFGSLAEEAEEAGAERLMGEGGENGTGCRPKASPPSSSSSVSMVQFARDELASHAASYRRLLVGRVRVLLSEWCGASYDDVSVGVTVPDPCLQALGKFVLVEQYELDSSAFGAAESDDRLDAALVGPLRNSEVLRGIAGGMCDADVALLVVEEMSSNVAKVIIRTILGERKRFTDWGSLLLSKQVRSLQNFLCSLVLNEGGEEASIPNGDGGGGSVLNTASILNAFERLTQAVTVLQLEKPSDWSAFSYQVGEGTETNVTKDEIKALMSLRVDFSDEAISAVCDKSSA